MSYNYYEEVKKSLKEYKTVVLNIKEEEFWVGNQEKPYGHILPKEQGNMNIIKGTPSPFVQMKLHVDAHHLNSSQMMCYNFFRPYIKCDKGEKIEPQQELFDLIQNIGIEIEYTPNAFCSFEYVQKDNEWENEGTNFDFYIRSGNKELFFEIKYTENGFGSFSEKDASDTRKKKVKELYMPKIASCPTLQGKISSMGELGKNYQIIRNVIRVQDNDKYVIFITDKNNPTTTKQLEQFKNTYIQKDWEKNIRFITWQELVAKAKEVAPTKTLGEFERKYLSYKTK